MGSDGQLLPSAGAGSLLRGQENAVVKNRNPLPGNVSEDHVQGTSRSDSFCLCPETSAIVDVRVLP